jgi:autotransporter-associated beta strand protein
VTLSANASVGADNSLTVLQLGAINLQSSTLTTSGSGEVYFGGNITGTGGITIGGSGPVFFVGGQNNFTGLTDVLADGYVGLNDTSGTAISGNLTIEDTAEVLDAYGGQFASSTIVTINGDGQLVLTPYGTTVAETIAGVVSTSTDSQVSSYGSSPGTSALTLDGSGTYDFTGFVLDAVNSPLKVVKEGTGSQEFDGANTYSGGTTLNAGTLIAGNSSAFGTGLMQVNGGRLMMGNNTHTLTVGSYAQTGGTLYLQLAGAGQAATADQLHVTNSSASQVALGGNLTVDLSGFTNPAPHGTPVSYTFDLLDTDAGYTGKFASFDVIDSATGLIPSLDYTGDDVLLHLSDLLPSGGLTSNQRAILNSIDAGLSGNQVPPPLTALFTALTPYSSNPAVLGAALDQLSAQAFGQFASATAFNNASFETQALDNYLETRRGADGGFLAGHGAIDSSGLTANDPSYDPNLSMIHSRLLAWNPAPFDGTISDVDEMLPGGVEMKDSKNGTPAEMEAHPWNVFIRGNVVLAQGFSGEDTSHFDDNTESVVLGADYRLTPHFLVGLTAGFAHTDVTLDDNGSSATVDSYSPGFYASYADQGWYANLSGNYLHNAYTQDRVIGFLDQTATSSPQGNEGVANLDGGYDFHQGALTFGPLAGLQYTHLSVDGYKESGSLAALDVDNDDSDSLRSRFGGHLSYAFSHDGIHFTPHLDASWQHEFLDQSRGLTSQFGFGGGSFGVRTINPSRDSALVDAGLDADLNRTVTVFADYVIQAGQENYFGQSIQAGLKIGF